MDPLSIYVSASTLATAVFTAGRYLHDFIANAKNVDARVKDISTSMDGLHTILQAMKNVFDTPGTQQVLKGAKDIGTLLGAVKTSIDDCLVTTNEVQKIFESIRKEKADSQTLLAKSLREFKMRSKQDELDRIATLIHTHKTNMTLSLQTVNVFVTSKTWQVQMDELRALIKEMRLEQPDQDAVGSNVAQHTQALQTSAQFLVSRQHTLVSNDDDDWMRISRHSTGFSGSTSRANSMREDDVLDSDDEMEADLSIDLLDGGIELCDQGKYKEAEATLRNSIQDAMRKKLLDRHRDKIKLAQLRLGTACIWQGKFDAADPILKGIAALPTDVEGMESHLPLSLDALYYLSQISLAYHDFTSALRDCQKVVRERKKLYGKNDDRYIQSLILLVIIQKTSGDEVSAKAYSKQIPADKLNNRSGVAVLQYTSEGMDMSVQSERETIKFLEKEGPGSEDSTGGHNFRWAAINGHLNVVRLLVHRGVDLESKDMRRQTALCSAARGGHFDIAKFLVARGAKVDPEGGGSPLHGSTEGDYADCARLLLDHGAKVDGFAGGEIEEDFCPLITAAYHGGDRCLQLLLDYGASPEVWNKSRGRTALMYAARENHPTSCQILLKAGADVNKMDREGETALTHAASNGSIGLLRLLLDGGASPDPPSNAPKNAHTALCALATNKDVELPKLLLDRGADPNRKGRDGQAPLQLASRWSSALPMMKILLERGADPNQAVQDPQASGTPLYATITDGNRDGALLLIEAGADVNQVSYGDRSPLAAAERSSMSEVSEALFDKGATLQGNAVSEEAE